MNVLDMTATELAKAIKEGRTTAIAAAEEVVKQIELKEQLKEKDAAIKEAVELIETLTTDPNARELLYSNKGKKYYLDNFPDEAREMIESIIKEYYDKTSG